MTMGTNSDQHHRLGAEANEIFDDKCEVDEDCSSSTSDRGGEEVPAVFSSFEFLEGSQPQSLRKGKGHRVRSRLLVCCFLSSLF